MFPSLKALPVPFSQSALNVARRSVSLVSDAIVLTLASPFFAVWGLYRLSRYVALRLKARAPVADDSASQFEADDVDTDRPAKAG